MLVLSRKIGEADRIGDEIKIVVLEVNGGRVKLGFTARQMSISVAGGCPMSGSSLKSTTVAESKPVVAASGDAGREAAAPLRAFSGRVKGCTDRYSEVCERPRRHAGLQG